MFLCFEIKEQILKRSKKHNILSGTANYYECKFTTCSKWYDFEKTVLFISKDNKAYPAKVTHYEDNKYVFVCKIPKEVLNDTFKIMVVGEKNDIRITTNTVTEWVKQSGYTVDTVQAVKERGYWSLFQIDGERTDYRGAFFNCILRELFKPIYDIKPIYADYMFMLSKLYDDLSLILQEQNIILDTSKCQSMTRMFYQSSFTAVCEIDCRKVQELTQTFAYCDNLEKIKKLIISEKCTFINTFSGLSQLKDIVIEGNIGNDVDFGDCINLSADSIKSIVECLSDSVTGCTVTLPAEAAERLEDFEQLVSSKANWCFIVGGDEYAN